MQIAYSLLARARVATPHSGIRLYLDGQIISGRLTRRTTGRIPGLLEPGQAEYGWIVLGSLTGERLQLEWVLEGHTLTKEWRLH